MPKCPVAPSEQMDALNVGRRQEIASKALEVRSVAEAARHDCDNYASWPDDMDGETHKSRVEVGSRDAKPIKATSERGIRRQLLVRGIEYGRIKRPVLAKDITEAVARSPSSEVLASKANSALHLSRAAGSTNRICALFEKRLQRRVHFERRNRQRGRWLLACQAMGRIGCKQGSSPGAGIDKAQARAADVLVKHRGHHLRDPHGREVLPQVSPPAGIEAIARDVSDDGGLGRQVVRRMGGRSRAKRWASHVPAKTELEPGVGLHVTSVPFDRASVVHRHLGRQGRSTRESGADSGAEIYHIRGG